MRARQNKSRAALLEALRVDFKASCPPNSPFRAVGLLLAVFRLETVDSWLSGLYAHPVRLRPKTTAVSRLILTAGLLALFCFSAFAAATHLHSPLGDRIQQQCRLCTMGDLRQVVAPKAWGFLSPPAFLALASLPPKEAPSPAFSRKPLSRSPPLWT